MFTILIPIWKRPKLTDRVIEYYKSRQKKFNFNLVVVGSEDSEYGSKKGVDYVHTDNFPVSYKWNTGFEYCKKYNNPVVIIGSDDYVSEEVLSYYNTLPSEGNYAIQFRELYHYRAKDQKLTYWKSGKMGAGRFFSLESLNACQWRICNHGKNNAIDYAITQTLNSFGTEWKLVELEKFNGVIVDVKYSDNISPHAIVDAGELRPLKYLPEYIQKELLILNKEYVNEFGVQEIQYEPTKTQIMQKIIAVAHKNSTMIEGKEYEVGCETAKVLIEKGMAYDPDNKPAVKKPTPKKKASTKKD